jgi:hypothetical protein
MKLSDKVCLFVGKSVLMCLTICTGCAVAFIGLIKIEQYKLSNKRRNLHM